MPEIQIDFKKLGKGVQIAEAQREAAKHTGFMCSVFRGRPDFSLIIPWPKRSWEDIKKESAVIDLIYNFFEDVDPAIVNGEKDIPWSLIEQMSEMGFFRLKVPEVLGGMGLSQTSYTNIIAYLSSRCPAIAIVVSADNTIGAKFPVLHLGTEAQKAKYLPRLCRWPSAFCFTEKDVGSDPARMRTYAMRVRNQEGNVAGYKITGEKWYATNSVLNGTEPLSEYLAVVARIVDAPEDLDNESLAPCFGLFVVSTATEGFSIKQRTQFLGMHGIFNGILIFKNMSVDKEELIGGEGMGFKIALQGLNTGRIAIGGSCTAIAKQALSIINWWAKERKQWGRAIGEWELIGSGMCAVGAANIFAMEAMTMFACARVDQKLDSRLEAAICKVMASEWGWTVIDNMMQARGGRGYETGDSLSQRELTTAVDRIFRDSRPNRIFEGSTQILSQWVIREGLDDYLKRGAPFFKKGMYWKKFKAAVSFGSQYLKSFFPKSLRISSYAWFDSHGIDIREVPRCCRKHLKFVERSSRRLSRAIIWLSAKYRDKMMVKQLTLARLYAIASELYAMTAACSYALHWDNDDSAARKVAKKVLNKEYPLLEKGAATVEDIWMKNC